jgi:hypothetical protein
MEGAGMTRYAVDRKANSLVAVWGTGRGDVTETVLPSTAAQPDALLVLADRMTKLSEQLWRCYVFPSSAYKSVEPNTEGWRQQRSRHAFERVVPTVEAREERAKMRATGLMHVSYNAVERAAELVAEALLDIEDDAVAPTIIAELREELIAVERAELGDLSGRAQQAVLLSRIEASPVQIQAADQLLREDPLGSIELFTQLEPTAAAVAAAHWLYAAANVASEVSGTHVTEVLTEADNIEAIQTRIPNEMLEFLDLGVSAHKVIAELVHEALLAAQGEIAHIGELEAAIAEVNEQAEEYRESDPELYQELRGEIRISLLDPRRPSLDLLEDLLSGIYGCSLIYREYSDDEPYPYDEDDDEFDADEQEAFFQERFESQLARFADKVRVWMSKQPPLQ